MEAARKNRTKAQRHEREIQFFTRAAYQTLHAFSDTIG
jgi:hypothetical protein